MIMRISALFNDSVYSDGNTQLRRPTSSSSSSSSSASPWIGSFSSFHIYGYQYTSTIHANIQYIFKFRYISLHGCHSVMFTINLLKPTGHVMHQQFNIQQLYVLPTLYLCVLFLSANKQRLVPLTA